MLVAMLTEKCYERLSLRDDSSDMSEHTKEILKVSFIRWKFREKKIKLTKYMYVFILEYIFKDGKVLLNCEVK